MNLAKIYTDEVYQNLRPLYANWEPTKPIKLGDFGLMNDNFFNHLGNISAFKINFNVRESPAKDYKNFSSRGSVSVSTHDKGSFPINGIMNASAALEINFSNEDAVFFNAADCNYKMIDDKVRLGEEIMEKFHAQVWKHEWAIVTDLVQAGSTTVAISGAKNAGLLLEAKGNVQQMALADASIGLNVKNSTNVGYQVISADGLIPLIGLCKIQPRFIFWKTFSPVLRGGPQILRDSRQTVLKDEVQGAEDDLAGEPIETLYFGQLN